MLITCKDKEDISKLTMYLKSEFEMKDLGEAKRILGINIKRDRKKGTLILFQSINLFLLPCLLTSGYVLSRVNYPRMRKNIRKVFLLKCSRKSDVCNDRHQARHCLWCQLS